MTSASLRELEELAAELRVESRRTGSVLTTPRGGFKGQLDDDKLILPRLTMWDYFNPFGPTMCMLSWVPLAGGDRLIALQMDNPFQEEGVVYGILAGSLPQSAVHAALVELFRRNGSEDFPLLGSLPSSVAHRENSPWQDGTEVPILSAAEVRDLFRAVFPLIVTDAEALRTTCDKLREFRLDPWGLAGWERDQGLEAIAASLGTHKESRLAEVGGERSSQTADRSGCAALFDTWFDLVSDSQHVLADLSQFDKAWDGAIRFRSGEWGPK